MSIKIPLLLVQFIKETNERTIKKGTALFLSAKEEIELLDISKRSFSLEVPSQSTGYTYSVMLDVENDSMLGDCDCPAYNQNFECKHCIAAAMHVLMYQYEFSIDDLQDILKIKKPAQEEIFLNNIFKQDQQVKASIKDVSIINENIANNEWKHFNHIGPLSQNILYQYAGHYGSSYLDLKKVSSVNFDKANLHWTFLFQQARKELYQPEIKYDAQQTYYYKCNCVTAFKSQMCKHVRATFDKLISENGGSFFLTYKDWTTEKNKLLKPYGISVNDDESKAFEFHIDHYDRLQVKPPPGFYKEGDVDAIKTLSVKLRSKFNAAEHILRPLPVPGTLIDFEIAYVINITSKRLGLGFELEAAKLYIKPGRQDIKKLSLNTAASLPLLKQLDDEAYSLLLQFSDEKLIEGLKTRGHYINNHYTNPWNQINNATLDELRKRYIKAFIQFWPKMVDNGNIFFLEQGSYSTKNCKPITITNDGVTLSFVVIADEKFITIRLKPVFDNMLPSMPEDKVMSYYLFMFRRNNTMHLIKNIEDIGVIDQFTNGVIKIPVSQKLETIKNVIAPLQERYPVELPVNLQLEILQTEMKPHVLLKEFNEQFLMLQPQFLYNDNLVDYSAQAEDIFTEKEDGSLQLLRRDTAKEKQFYETLRPLHESFN
ncbi:MAG: hypothetical protein ABIT58_01435, partial [Ferruginibacter sp.]